MVLTGSAGTHDAVSALLRLVPKAKPINLNLTLSQRLLDLPSYARPAGSPVAIAELLSGSGPLVLYNFELLFSPALRLEPLNVLKEASRYRALLVIWTGESHGDALTYATPDHPDYRRYNDLADVLVIPFDQLAQEA